MLELIKNPILNYFDKSQNSYYIKPHSLLKPYISHYTISFPGNNIVSKLLTLIPDASGCIIFTFDGNQLDSQFWGPTTKTVIVKNDINNVPIRIFVEFLPCGAYHFTGIKQSEISDLRVSLEDINPSLNRNVNIEFERSKNIQEFIDKLNFLLLSCLSNVKGSDVVIDIVPHLQKYSGALSVKSISDITFYSERHLNRIFNQFLGMSVKTYSRLIRINRVLQSIKEEEAQFTGLAQELGYYDQAHFTHDFKAVCGVNPTEYKRKMSDFYNDEFKF